MKLYNYVRPTQGFGKGQGTVHEPFLAGHVHIGVCIWLHKKQEIAEFIPTYDNNNSFYISNLVDLKTTPPHLCLRPFNLKFYLRLQLRGNGAFYKPLCSKQISMFLDKFSFFGQTM